MTTDLARKAVLERLAAAHEHWSEEEQLLKAQGKPIESEGAHQLARTCLRAYVAELNDPPPPQPLEV